MKVNSTDVKTNFGKYLELAKNEDIIITRNNKPVAKLVKYRSYEEGIREGAPDYTYDQVKMSYEEFMEMYNATDARFEFINGVVYAMGSPVHIHQHIVTNLLGEFYNYFKDKPCKPYVAPYDIHFLSDKSKNVVQPDIFVMCDPENIREGRYYGVPTLVIEVLSPSTRNKDMIEKNNLYLQSGVKEYIIIDPKNENLIHWRFADQSIERCDTHNIDDVFESTTFEGLKFKVGELFEG